MSTGALDFETRWQKSTQNPTELTKKNSLTLDQDKSRTSEVCPWYVQKGVLLKGPVSFGSSLF